ncbi:glycosyltransferase family 2 protein [Butyrivibrio sp. AE3006]|uniref:glycosyltransferase family 2 protein n=1 Tax=Butyrivibrio sp. AE3006 TaxID=1280673 RepID=UPI00040DB51F|nr:glycosyltransferase [Butyrivibrio sp. AE3006]
MKSGLISIIVPVYNVEKYLKECLDSILAQKYENFEVILIDDGSKDNSGCICDEYAQKDNRIKVIHQENKGLAGARNTGLDAASGEYICFVDSDDKISNSYLEDFVKAMDSSNADLAICNFESARLVDDERNDDCVFSAAELRHFLYDDLSRKYVEIVVSWNKIYKAELIQKYRFETGKIHEDEFMINNLLYDINKAAYISTKNYYYRVNDDGITGSGNYNNPGHLDAVDALVERVDKAAVHDDREFAVACLKIALYKLVSFYKSGDENLRSLAKAKYRDIYFRYSWLFDLKKRGKYLLFVNFPKVFCKLFANY